MTRLQTTNGSTLPKISIIITSYMETAHEYLDLCIQSIHNLSYPKELLDIVLVTKPGYHPEYSNVKTIYPNKEQFYNPVGINYGVANSDQDSKYIFLLNDDLILTKDCLQPLVDQAQDNDIILMPLLSCHQNWRYTLMMGHIEGDKLYQIQKRFNRLEDWLPIKDKLMNSNSIYPPGILHESHLCMVASLIPRKTWNKVGGFDENFTCGQDDTDYSMRARKLGIPLGICLNSLVYHFGGVTTSESAGDLKSELRNKNKEYFKEKWGFSPP